MTTTINATNSVEKTQSTYAIPMDPAHYQLVKDAAEKLGLDAAKFGRGLVLAEAAKVMGVEVPVVVQGKRGPKGGSKHPLAEKHNLSTVEFNRRLAFAVHQHASSGSKRKFDMDKVDFSVNPFAKVEEVPASSTEVVTADTAVTA